MRRSPILLKLCPILLLPLTNFAAVSMQAQDRVQIHAPDKTVVLSIQVDKPLHSVSPMLYGLMTEEINYSYDGGLYPEMVKNRTLRERDWNQQDWLIVQNA